MRCGDQPKQKTQWCYCADQLLIIGMYQNDIFNSIVVYEFLSSYWHFAMVKLWPQWVYWYWKAICSTIEYFQRCFYVVFFKCKAVSETSLWLNDVMLVTELLCCFQNHVNKLLCDKESLVFYSGTWDNENCKV